MFKKLFDGVNHGILWPSMILTAAVVVISLVNPDGFVSVMSAINAPLINGLGGIASATAVLATVVLFVVYFSPLGKVKLGGKDAKPIMSDWNWFAITLCTTIATGCVFWGMVQPIIHMETPAMTWGCEPHSWLAVVKTMSTMFYQWTFVPYAIYALPCVMFAIVYFNRRQPYGITSTLEPVLGEKGCRKIFTPLSAILLFATVVGAAGCLGNGLLNMSGAAKYLFNIDPSPMLFFCIASIFVIPAIISAITGILKGIRILSDLNMKIYFVLLLFFFITCTNKSFMINLSLEAIGDFIMTFFQQGLQTGAASGDAFPSDWINYNFAIWMSAIVVPPIFLGSLCKGRTVREVIFCNLMMPAFFGFIWMTLISGSTIWLDLSSGGQLTQTMAEMGSTVMPYAVFGMLPFSKVMTVIYLVACLISFVTYTDSTLTSMATLTCTKASDQGEATEGHFVATTFIKILFGAGLIVVTAVMISGASMDGARILANMAGWPMMIVELLIIAGFFKLLKHPERCEYENYGKDYSEEKREGAFSFKDMFTFSNKI